MPIPLGKLVEEETSIYELTSATIHRASQLAVTGGEEVEEHKGKIVSAAIDQMLNHKFEYKVEEK